MILSEIVYNIFKDDHSGTFVEFGANDGIQQSNTLLLEQKNNWSGMLIEPSPSLFDSLRKNRKNCIVESCAVSDKNGKLLGDFDGKLMSSVEGKRLNIPNLIEVECFTLNYLCAKHKISKIDLCSIDVEGHEKTIIKSIDFSCLNILNFIVEIYENDAQETIDYLLGKGYDVKCVSNFNKNDNPGWDGTHQDYLFTKKSIHLDS